MALPRWFELTLLEAEDAEKTADYSHLGEQLGLRIEEVVPRQAMKSWVALAEQWTDDSKLKKGELGEQDEHVLAFLAENCPEVLQKVPEAKRAELLRGLFRKRR